MWIKSYKKSKRAALTALYLFAVLIISFGLCGCKKSENTKTLVVGTSVDLPPFCNYDQYGNPDGFDIALIKAMAEKMGYTSVEFKTMEYNQLISRLNSGQMDCIVSAMSVNDDRKNTVLFSDIYYTSHQVIILRNNINEKDDIIIKEMGDLATRHISVAENTMGDRLASLIVSDSEKITRRENTNAAINEVINGRSAAAVIEEEAAFYQLKKNGTYIHRSDADLFPEKPFAIAIRKGNDEFAEEINAALDEVKSDGTYNELVEKYIAGN